MPQTVAARHVQTASEEPTVISVYTRKNALDDGTLVDVSESAREAGFKLPVAMTAASFSRCVAWTDADSRRTGTPQDQSGRLWDVVWMAVVAVRSVKASGGRPTSLARDVRQGADGSSLVFSLYVVPRDKGGRARKTSLRLTIGPGDDLEAVATILETDED